MYVCMYVLFILFPYPSIVGTMSLSKSKNVVITRPKGYRKVHASISVSRSAGKGHRKWNCLHLSHMNNGKLDLNLPLDNVQR